MIIKQEIDGPIYTGVVANVEDDNTGQFGAQIKFTFENGDVFYAHPQLAERQAGFNKLGYVTDFIGETVEIERTSRKAPPGKSYTNIVIQRVPAVASTRPVAVRTPVPARGATTNLGKQPHSLGPKIEGLDDLALDLELIEDETAAFVKNVKADVPTRPAVPVATRKPSVAEMDLAVQRRYKAHFDWVLDNIVTVCAESAITYDLAAINAICATLIIQGSK